MNLRPFGHICVLPSYNPILPQIVSQWNLGQLLLHVELAFPAVQMPVEELSTSSANLWGKSSRFDAVHLEFLWFCPEIRGYRNARDVFNN